MKLTPLDIHHKEFRTALRGYNEKEVDEFLDQVADEFERLFKENVDLSERLNAALERVQSYEGMKDTLQNTLVVAQQHAEQMQSDATARSEMMLKEADLKSQQIVGDALAEKQRVQQEVLRIRKAEEEYRAAMAELLEHQIKQVEAVPVPPDFPTAEDIADTRTAVAEVASRPAGPTYADVIGAPVPASAAEPAVAGKPAIPPAAPVAAAAASGAAYAAFGEGVAPAAEVFDVPGPTPVPSPPVAETQLPPAAAPQAAAVAPEATGLTLGEVEPPVLDVPAFTDPAEFSIPGYGAAEEDSDIEEID